MHARQFSLKDLFLGTTLASLGLGLVTLPYTALFAHSLWYMFLIPQAFWLGGGALIGAGILVPFKKPLVGAAIGFAVQVVIFYVYFLPLATLFGL